jgi:hypothetical protein
MHMTALIRHITVDCLHPYELSLFWREVTGFPENPDDHPGDPEALLHGPDGHPGLLFVRVAEDEKVVKNRLHFDLQPTDRTRDEEVARLTDLGATVVNDHRRPDNTGWVTLADPEGNEFCVEPSLAERDLA